MRADLIERLREIAYRDSAKNVTVRAEDLRDALDALASLQSGPAGEVEPVAWQWRHRSQRINDRWSDWSDWKDGRQPELRTASYESEERALVVATPAKAGGGETTHRHVKSGHLVRVLGVGKMQSSNWADAGQYHAMGAVTVDMREVVIYEHDGNLWARPREEFEDGRFVASPSPDAERQEGSE